MIRYRQPVEASILTPWDQFLWSRMSIGRCGCVDVKVKLQLQKLSHSVFLRVWFGDFELTLCGKVVALARS